MASVPSFAHLPLAAVGKARASVLRVSLAARSLKERTQLFTKAFDLHAWDKLRLGRTSRSAKRQPVASTAGRGQGAKDILNQLWVLQQHAL